MRTSSWRERLPLVLIPLGIFVMSMPVADAAFRLLGDRPAAALEGLFVSFGGRNYKHAPRVSTDAHWSTGRFAVVTDDFGLRTDRARSLAARAGEPVHWIVIGDSQGFGQGVDYEESLVGGFAALAATNGIRVANAAIGGHYLANQYELFQWLRDRVGMEKTRVLLLLTPRLIETAGEFNAPRVGADGRLYGREPTSWQRATLWIKTQTVLYTRLRDAVRQLGLLQGERRAGTALDVYPAGAAAAIAERKLVDSLRAFMSAASLSATDLWIVYAPLAAELDFEPIGRMAVAKGVEVDPDAPGRIAAAAAAALQVRFLDLRSTLARLQSDGVRLSLPGDPHYSAAASRASAEAIWASGPSDTR